MKSGPALAPTTRKPRRRRYRSRPAVSRVLPLPEAGAARISPRACIRTRAWGLWARSVREFVAVGGGGNFERVDHAGEKREVIRHPGQLDHPLHAVAVFEPVEQCLVDLVSADQLARIVDDVALVGGKPRRFTFGSQQIDRRLGHAGPARGSDLGSPDI